MVLGRPNGWLRDCGRLGKRRFGWIPIVGACALLQFGGAAGAKAGPGGVVVDGEASGLAGTSCTQTPPGSVCVDCARTAGAFPAAWPYVSNLGPSNGPISDRLIRKLGIKYSRMFYAAPIWSCGEGCYDYTAPEKHDIGWGDDHQIAAIMTQGAVPILNIGSVPSWLGENVNGPPHDYAKYKALWKAALLHIAVKFPQIYYLEAFNEPEYGKISANDVDQMYSSLVSAVAQVYAATGHRFLVGGPAAGVPLDSGVMTRFLAYVAGRHLPLDFVSYHVYAGAGGRLGDIGEAVRAALAAYRLNPDLPQFVTEWARGGSNHKWNSVTAAADAVWMVQGWAGALSAGLGSIVQPEMTWETNCYIGDPNNSMFVTGPYVKTPDGTTCPGPDGPVMPAYNIYRMMSMQRALLVSPKGINDRVGLSPIASEDRSGAALMLATPAPADAKIKLVNLPAKFKSRPFTYAEYLVNSETSNYAYAQRRDGALQRIAGGAAPKGTSFATSVSLRANSVLMVVLQPR
jgi:hypothetical protein